ncbi:MAG: sigma-70 region 4 domain-containing protein [Clostridia bacterium]|nr:sigma-70 region 4 domain-containing protein [Clostridia bacterium]
MEVNQMNIEQKQKIFELRSNGQSYLQIAQTLRVSENTVKSFCRRNINKPEKVETSVAIKTVETKESLSDCKHCGKPLIHADKGQPKKFCSEKCRRIWWKANDGQIDRKAWYALNCSMCGIEFESYGNRNRRFCSHACYIKKRFEKGGGENDKRAI